MNNNKSNKINNNANNNLNILYTTGDSYAPYTGISIFSLLDNNKEFQNISIHIFDMGISDANKNKLIHICKMYHNSQIFFHEIKLKSILESFSINYKNESINNYTFNTFAKLLAASLLPDIDKILFIDSDTIITNSFKKLCDEKLEEYCIGAVLDLSVCTISNQHIKQNLSLSNDDYYINSGFIYMNLEKWREKNLEKRFKNYINNNILPKLILMDQDVLNVCLRNEEILILAPEFNVIMYFYGFEYLLYKSSSEDNNYSKESIMYAIKNPIIVHFSGSDTGRPWYDSKWISLEKFFFSSKHHKFNSEYKKYYDLYAEYAESSPWKYKYMVKDKRLFIVKTISLSMSIFPRLFSLLLYLRRKIFSN